MKTSFSRLLKLTVLAGAFVGVSFAASAQEFKLRWGHYLPNSPFVQVEKDFAKKIEERTNGRVEIDITFAGGLGKGNEVALLAGRGAIDMASVAMGYYPDQLLFWKAYQIPFIFDDPVQAINIVHKSYKEFPIFKQESDKINVNYLFQQPLGSYYMTGPSPNCTSVKDLKGKKFVALALTFRRCTTLLEQFLLQYVQPKSTRRCKEALSTTRF
jgi:TRAP-type C4-dicarboxylate transport system substrate-binding protein